MSENDFYVESGRQRLQDIAAERAEALASLERAKASGDYQTAGFAVQQVANLDSEYGNLMRLYQQYWNSQHPPAPPEPTREERLAKPLERMDYRDVWELSKSKYGPPR